MRTCCGVVRAGACSEAASFARALAHSFASAGATSSVQFRPRAGRQTGGSGATAATESRRSRCTAGFQEHTGKASSRARRRRQTQASAGGHTGSHAKRSQEGVRAVPPPPPPLGCCCGRRCAPVRLGMSLRRDSRRNPNNRGLCRVKVQRLPPSPAPLTFPGAPCALGAGSIALKAHIVRCVVVRSCHRAVHVPTYFLQPPKRCARLEKVEEAAARLLTR